MAKSQKKIIGRGEKVDFPALSLNSVPVKIDTGAYSSAIHCSSIEINDQDLLEVIFLEESESGYTGKLLVFDAYEIRKIKSSNGITEERYTIDTDLNLGGSEYPIRLTLAERSAMRFPVLIGRRFLKRNRFVVDPQKLNLYSDSSKN